MNIRFYNGKICTMEQNLDPVEGELWVQDKRVAYAGPATEPTMPFSREIDLDGNLIMPGFKNAHTHSAMTFLRSYADDLPLQEWLERQVFPMEAKLRPEQAYYLNTLAIMEYLTSGITAVMDMYFYPAEMIQASIDSGFRTVLTGAITDYGMSLKELENGYLHCRSIHERISSVIGFHAEYTCSEKLLRSIVELSNRYGAPVFTHMAETRREAEECVQRHGMTPAVYLDSLGMFRHGGGGYHCVHMTEEDLDVFARLGLCAVTNPGSNCKLASGIAPLSRMLEKGISTAIGTDGPASNNCLDMFREMFLATAMQKIALNDASALEAEQVLRMATINGARAMRLTDCDTLSVGKLADLIVIDLKQPNMQPENNIMKNIVYSGSKQNVKLTMVNGKILYEDGRFNIGIEPDEVYRKANNIIESMRV